MHFYVHQVQEKTHLWICCGCAYMRTLSPPLKIKDASKVICFDIYANAFKTRNWFGLGKCITLQITQLFEPYLSNQFCGHHPRLPRHVSLRFQSILTLSGEMILQLAKPDVKPDIFYSCVLIIHNRNLPLSETTQLECRKRDFSVAILKQHSTGQIITSYFD